VYQSGCLWDVPGVSALADHGAPKAVAQAEETRNRVHEHLGNADGTPTKRGPGRPPKAAASLEQVAQDVEDARQAHQRLAAQHETVTPSIRAIAQHEHLSETCLERIEKAARVVPTMQATIAFVLGYVCQQVRQLDVVPPVSYAMHAHLIPAWYLDRVASIRSGIINCEDSDIMRSAHKWLTR
jgi:hypothetical protein